MKLSTKFAFIFVAIVLVSMLIVILAVHQTVTERFQKQYEQTVLSSLSTVATELRSRKQSIRQRLDDFAARLAEDYEFRLQVIVLKKPEDQRVTRYAGNFMPTMGLDALAILDSHGIVLSSGHNRASYGSRNAGLASALAKAGEEITFSRFKGSRASFISLAAITTVELSGQLFYILGGTQVDSLFLASLTRDDSEILAAVFPDEAITSTAKLYIDSTLVQEVPEATIDKNLSKSYTIGSQEVSFISPNGKSKARVFLFHPKTALTQLISALDRAFLFISAVGITLAVILASWVTRSVARPLRRLAETAGDLSLDRLDARFDVHSNDEVGILNNALDGMQKRLRSSKVNLAEAEKKAAFAQIARQVNHDIKNGFLPIRNIMKHWEEIAHDKPGQLLEIFKERKAAVLDSVEYLEKLARGYSRLKPELNMARVDVAAILAQLADNYKDIKRDIELDTKFETDLFVEADAVQLKRAFENILTNALDAIEGAGRILISAAKNDDLVTVRFEDTGVGIPAPILDKVFQPHFTTKDQGSGLGLGNVRAIVQDFGGSINVASEPGQGTTFTIEFPAKD